MPDVADTQDARIEESDGIITVTFTRPDKRNAINVAMFDALEAALDRLERDDALRVMVIAAEGPYFTSGVDISIMRADLGTGTDGRFHGSNMRREYRLDARHDLFDRFERVEKPVIAAIGGRCLGAGVEFSTSCDFRIVSDQASFTLPEIANLAVIPASGGISRLTRLIGRHWAKWLVMMGETVSAEQAMQIGLVHAVHPAESFDEAVRAAALRLAGMSREALDLAKVAIDSAAFADRRAARDFDRVAQTLLFTGDEHRALVDRFLGKS